MVMDKLDSWTSGQSEIVLMFLVSLARRERKRGRSLLLLHFWCCFNERVR